MAKFDFQLDGVLRHRKHLEQERQRDLAAIQSQMTALQHELRKLNEAVAATNEDVRQNRLIGELDLSFLAAHRRFMNATQRQAMVIAQKMTLVQRQIDAAQQQLIEAVKQRKVIEKLRDRYKQRWQADLDRKELAQLDEIGMQLNYGDRYTGEEEVAR